MTRSRWRTGLAGLVLAASVLSAGCAGILPGTAPQAAGEQSASAKRNGFAPAWVKDAVFYQIFPERFANGNRANDPKGTEAWGGKPGLYNYFGGDLAGVRTKIPYLKSLGITAIYFNPIFSGDSNHKYNTTDYMTIDPAFGTNAEFKSLLDELHRNGIKVILDGVFNHTSNNHSFFQDAVKNGPKSKYWNYYTIWGYPVVDTPKPNYNAWWGFGTLPQLTGAKNREVQEYLLSVTSYWTKMGIDGWRLDVPNELDNWEFWREWRRTVKAINPNAYTVGEIWTDGKDWLKGDIFDAVMNYLFREQALDFFAHRKTAVDALDSNLAGLRAHYGQAVTEAGFNILSSHDVPRVRTEAGGDQRAALEALTFMFTNPGAPVLYYGDELGMEGAKDPDNRRTMTWETAKDSNPTLAYVKKLIAVRQAHPALRGGTLKSLMRHNHFRQYVYLRENAGEKVVVAMNSGDEDRPMSFEVAGAFPEGAKLVDYLTGKQVTVQDGKVSLGAVPKRTSAILGLAGKR